MMSDRDIFATATVMVRRYGADAATEAARRSDQLLDDGDTLGATVWRRVAAAVEDLARQAPRDGEGVH